jgi:hypothetical protein
MAKTNNQKHELCGSRVLEAHDGGSFNGNSALVNVLDILIFFYTDRLNYTLLFGIPILYLAYKWQRED